MQNTDSSLWYNIHMATKATKKTSTETASKQVDAVEVVNKGGWVVRTYSKDVHGDKFIELATEYVVSPKRPDYSIRDARG